MGNDGGEKGARLTVGIQILSEKRALYQCLSMQETMREQQRKLFPKFLQPKPLNIYSSGPKNRPFDSLGCSDAK